MPGIVLASGSPYRRQLLSQLGLPFDCVSPDIDESALPGESPSALVARLADNKAKACVEQGYQGLIIGSDQVAAIDGQILTKPGSYEVAKRQLLQCSDRTVYFYTGLSLLNTASHKLHSAVETTSVEFRDLGEEQVERYLHREQPYDCAGSFKVEGLGISLFRKITGEDPNTLIGLPLIRLVEFLGHEGIAVP